MLGRASTLLELLRAARARRESVSNFSMYRLFDGAGDGFAELTIDKIGPFCLAHVLQGRSESQSLIADLSAASDFFLSELGTAALYLRLHEKDPKDTGSKQARLVCGRRVPEAQVEEHGVKLLVRPEANVNAGVFLDTREVRGYLAEHSQGAKVLNAFCFTGSLGIAAAAGGAREVVQVDSSRAMLDWAKENFALNGFPETRRMRFIHDDCSTFSRREARRIEEGREPYDIVILDPPSFGKAGSKVFQLRRDLPELVSTAAGLLAARGSFILTANNREMTPDSMAEIATAALEERGIRLDRITQLQAPAPDFTSSFRESSSMRGVLVSFSR